MNMQVQNQPVPASRLPSPHDPVDDTSADTGSDLSTQDPSAPAAGSGVDARAILQTIGQILMALLSQEDGQGDGGAQGVDGPGQGSGRNAAGGQGGDVDPDLAAQLAQIAREFEARLADRQNAGGDGGSQDDGVAGPGATKAASPSAPQTGAPAAAPAAGGPAPASAAQPAGTGATAPGTGANEAAAPAPGDGSAKKLSIDGGGSHTMHIKNTSSGDEDIGFIRNAGPGMSPGNEVQDHVKLKPGEEADVSMPDDWQGRVQDLQNGKGGQAAWFEYNNEKKEGGKLGGTWADAETTTGRDHAISFSSADGMKGGDTRHIADAAPEDLKIRNANGTTGLKGAELGGVVNQAVTDYESRFEPAKGQSATGQYDNYVLPNNDTATRHTNETTIDVEFGDA